MTELKNFTLPIYLIIAHSEIAFYINRDAQNKDKIIENTYFDMPDNKNKYLIYTTPGSTWSMLYENYKLEDKNHILNKSYDEIINTLFSLYYSSTNGTRINLLITDKDMITTLPINKVKYNIKEKLKSGFFLPNSKKIFNKQHEFYGENLSGYGKGIIKLSNKDDKATKLLDKNTNIIQDKLNTLNKLNKLQKPNDNYYFLAESKTYKDEQLNKFIEKKRLKKEDVSIKEILEIGDDGIYISLSCSELALYTRENVNINSRKHYIKENLNTDIMNTEINNKRFQLQSKLDDLINTNFSIHNKAWDIKIKNLSFNLSRKNFSDYIKTRKSKNSDVYFWYSPELQTDDNGWLSIERRKHLGLKPNIRKNPKILIRTM
tara:strand:- start:1416 stop:2540 length:1125 start_codon:yes stop_codon:yes gene_type:complete